MQGLLIDCSMINVFSAYFHSFSHLIAKCSANLIKKSSMSSFSFIWMNLYSISVELNRAHSATWFVFSNFPFNFRFYFIQPRFNHLSRELCPFHLTWSNLFCRIQSLNHISIIQKDNNHPKTRSITRIDPFCDDVWVGCSTFQSHTWICFSPKSFPTLALNAHLST